MSKNSIIITRAREHNLKNISLEIPKNTLTVITGVSGSGKSSLAFDTLYAEGQRRYVESLSSYARQFLGQMEKPLVDHIEGLSPAISIEQKAASKNPRSTVGTVTEIFDYLRVVFARIGTPHCHICGRETGAQNSDQIVEQLLSYAPDTKIVILAPIIKSRKGAHEDIFKDIQASGFTRIRINGHIVDLDENIELDKKRKHKIEVVVDRLKIRPDIRSRLSESVELALKIGDGMMIVAFDEGEEKKFSEKFACTECGISFEDLTPQLFSFNNPQGACPACNGLGILLEPSPQLILPDHSKPLALGIAPFGALANDSYTRRRLGRFAAKIGATLSTPINELGQEGIEGLLYGGVKGSRWEGVAKRVGRLYLETSSEGARNWYARFMAESNCTQCGGSRLKSEARAVLLGGKSLVELCQMPIDQLATFLDNLKLPENKQKIGSEILKELRLRVDFLLNIGLHYLNLSRSAPSLSGGESQRIRLASQIGSGLVGVLYVLDEPSIGLHQRDNDKLIGMLKHLRDIGNTVLVVEHDKDTMLSADKIVDLGPGAGELGGQIVAFGSPEEVSLIKESLTGAYLSGNLRVETPKKRRKPTGTISISGASHNNLKGVNASFPLGCFTCITGVSGSGKSSLISETLYPALANALNGASLRPGPLEEIRGFENCDKVIEVNQQPIGKTPRSNPATYVKVFDLIRALFAKIPEARARGYAPGRFSFNVKGGRCEDCQGAGVKCIEMHFLPDVYITCESCRGKRFNHETLQVKYKGMSISDILDMSVLKALELFADIPQIHKILLTLKDVGLDYIRLGQPSNTLSGGEAQRVKLAKELCRVEHGRSFYILDEPTTGLHPADVKMLLSVLDRLVEGGNTVVVIEHNMDVIKSADHIIDLGPEGGDGGGEIVAIGTPEEICENPDSWTGKYLAIQHLQ